VTAPTDEVLDQVRQALATARSAGEPSPGRPTLAKMTGSTEYQVRQALAVLANEDTAPEPATVDDATPGETLATVGEALASTIASTSPAGDNPDAPDRQKPHPEVPDTRAGEPVGAEFANAGDTVPDLANQARQHQLSAASPVVSANRLPRPWPLAFIALAAAVAVWGGWVRLGELTGFGPINVLPGIGNGLVIDTAVVLPLSVEFYGAYALRVLLASGGLSEKTKNFARWSFVTSLAVGGAAQIASHVMGAASVTTAPWWVTTLVACVPVLVVGLATGLATLVRQDASAGDQGGDRRA